MNIVTMHREDVKAELRKRFGSISKFEKARNLPTKSVSDLLRGRSSKRVQDEVALALFTGNSASDESDSSDRCGENAAPATLVTTGVQK